MAQLTLGDKIDILHSIYIDKETHKDAARKHFVKLALVQSLVTKAKRNKNFLADLRAEKEEVELKSNLVEQEAR